MPKNSLLSVLLVNGKMASKPGKVRIPLGVRSLKDLSGTRLRSGCINTTEDHVCIHDLHTTLLDLPGFDYTELTCRSQDRAFRLADMHSRIVEKLLV